MESKVCRVCYNNSGILNIFEEEKNGISVSQKIMYCCVNVKINKEDDLPSHICNDCEVDLTKAYQFVLKCEVTDKYLRSQNSFHNRQHDEIKNINGETKLEVKTEVSEASFNNENNLEDDYDFSDDFNIPLAAYHNVKPQDESENIKKIKCENDEKVEFTKISMNSNFHINTRKKKKKHKYKETGPQKCSICNRKCLTPSALIAHMRSHNNTKPFQCSSCDKSYKDPGSLKRHIDRNHLKNRERKFICETCGKGFYSKADVVTHFRSHTGETPFICSECPSSFTQLSSLIRHRKRHSDIKAYACPTCRKRFTTKDQLKAHSQIHLVVKKQFPCPLCNVLFKYKFTLNKHIKMHTEPNEFVCNYCGRMFKLKGSLKGHIDRVHSEKSGFCNICSKSVSNIEVHMWRHTGERPLKCEHCTSCFYELKALAHHMNFRHKHADKYKCTIEGCFKTFPSQPMVDFHIAKIHESKTKFPCDKCSRGFYRKSDLARHKIGTHKEKLL